MIYKCITILLIIVLSGCGGTSTSQDQNQSIKIDVNKTSITTEVNQTTIIDNNVTVVINPLDSGYYGDGSFLSPFTLMKANYKINIGDTWFITPIINSNCTIRVRSRVYINRIVVEDENFNIVPINVLSSNVFSFDLNDTRYATLNFYSTQDGYITTTGQCLDEPKYYNLGDK